MSQAHQQTGDVRCLVPVLPASLPCAFEDADDPGGYDCVFPHAATEGATGNVEYHLNQGKFTSLTFEVADGAVDAISMQSLCVSLQLEEVRKDGSHICWRDATADDCKIGVLPMTIDTSGDKSGKVQCMGTNGIVSDDGRRVTFGPLAVNVASKIAVKGSRSSFRRLRFAVRRSSTTSLNTATSPAFFSAESSRLSAILNEQRNKFMEEVAGFIMSSENKDVAAALRTPNFDERRRALFHQSGRKKMAETYMIASISKELSKKLSRHEAELVSSIAEIAGSSACNVMEVMARADVSRRVQEMHSKRYGRTRPVG